MGMFSPGQPVVLNALRHQRFGTHRIQVARQVAFECSTPYGIRGLAPFTIVIAESGQKVLNALRHQRFGTPGIFIEAAGGIMCSTPYGIRGLALLRP